MIRALYFLVLLSLPLSCARGDDAALEKGDGIVTVHPHPARRGLLRNPATGWVLYAESSTKKDFPVAEDYWAQADPYVPYASIFYIRCTWAQMEPEEGHFAWKENENFKRLIQDAADRHLHLAFRVIVNSRDCPVPATPDWVKAAGAAGYTENGTGKQALWTPQVDDLIFRHKFEKFVAAFAQGFDDPARVDYIDGGSLGWWGEMHHVETQDPKETFEWICRTYGDAFHHVLLGLQAGSQFQEQGKLDPMAFEQYGYVARSDSLGSFWLNEDKQKELAELYPKVPFYGESCYFSLDHWDIWKKDTRRSLNTVRDVLQATYDDALTCHANTLDLREPSDAATMMREAPDLLSAFISNAGYRLYPTSIAYPREIEAASAVPIKHTWKNLGAGILPNDNVRWGRKFHVGFGLIDAQSKQLVATAVDPDADPGQWITGRNFSSTCSALFSPTPPAGTYQLGVALVNTQDDNTPGIELATLRLPRLGGWILLGEIKVASPGSTATAPPD